MCSHISVVLDMNNFEVMGGGEVGDVKSMM